MSLIKKISESKSAVIQGINVTPQRKQSYFKKVTSNENNENKIPATIVKPNSRKRKSSNVIDEKIAKVSKQKLAPTRKSSRLSTKIISTPQSAKSKSKKA